jgi:hypothetical protein
MDQLFHNTKLSNRRRKQSLTSKRETTEEEETSGLFVMANKSSNTNSFDRELRYTAMDTEKVAKPGGVTSQCHTSSKETSKMSIEKFIRIVKKMNDEERKRERSKDRRIEWKEGRREGWKDRRIERWMEGWKDERMDVKMRPKAHNEMVIPRWIFKTINYFENNILFI